MFRGKPAGTLRHVRYHASADLTFWVEHYWIVEWNLVEPYVAQNLPHPSVHLVIGDDDARVVGVVTGKFERRLDGRGRVFGIKMRPGAFRPILGRAVSTITDGQLLLGDLLPGLEDAVRRITDDHGRIASAEAILRGQLPARDEAIEEVNQIIDLVLANHQITKVDDLVRVSGVRKRSLQRLFYEYVGVSPKWVISRYRLHEALERAASGGSIDWTSVAHELGYFDQAHFIRDFKRLVGMTPTQYASVAG